VSVGTSAAWLALQQPGDGFALDPGDGQGVAVTLGSGVIVTDGAAVRLGTGEALRVGVALGDGVGDGVGGVSAPALPKSRPYARISANTATMAATHTLDTRSSMYGSSSSGATARTGAAAAARG